MSEEAKDHSPATATDDDEFKSAESRTPPKERYGGSSDGNKRIIDAGHDIIGRTNYTSKTANRVDDDDTVTEHSSSGDEEHFVEARSSTA